MSGRTTWQNKPKRRRRVANSDERGTAIIAVMRADQSMYDKLLGKGKQEREIEMYICNIYIYINK